MTIPPDSAGRNDGGRTSYHYVITVQFETVNGIQKVAYGHGIIVPGPGESRSDVFRHLFEQMAVRGSNPVPLFFSLEPEDLIVTAGKEGQ